MSSASMMTEAVKGRTYEEALDMTNRFSLLMQGASVDFDDYDYEDIEALSGVCKFPARIKCATLAWNALKKGIDEE
ncbi:NifU-like protein [compost metagenome]